MKYSPDVAFVTLLDFETVDYICDTNGELMRELMRLVTFRSKSMTITVLYGVANKIVKNMPKNRKDKAHEIITKMSQTLQEILGDNGVLLFPSFPDTAHHHHDIFRRVFDTSYLALFNALGFPVTNCPLGLASDGMPLGIQVYLHIPNTGLLPLCVVYLL